MQKNNRVIFDYDIGSLVYVDKTGIYRKLYYLKHGVCRIIELFTNVTVQAHNRQAKKQINTISIEPHFR